MRGFYRLFVDAVSSWSEDYAPSMGAALSYYTLFSLAPLLLIVISVAGLVFGEEAARGELFEQLRGMLGNEGAATVEKLLASVQVSGKGPLASTIGIALLAVGATTVFAELQSDLDRIWRSPRDQSSGIGALVRKRLLSFGLILALGFLLIVSLVASAAIAALGKWWAPVFGDWEGLAQVINMVVSFGLLTAIFTLIYRLMPSVDIAWRDVLLGSAVTALLFTIGKSLIGLYIGTSGVGSGFGAAGSIVVVMVWVYYSAQIFLLGAEFTWVYAGRYGSRKKQAPQLAGTDSDRSRT
ncbi:MAG: YihY/virulence factor BrkB family protein [Burkholderiaceae bacterium]|nr:YihY/virulence factor BrkB family protein [Burkholderiaceae bacterium]